MEEIWIEKYRPRTLSHVAGQKKTVERLMGYASRKSISHLLFSGPAGTGKTTSAIALAHDLFGDNWKESFMELNASDERGIDVVRTKIKEYARTSSLNVNLGFKIIFLDEADALTFDAQSALRRTMEKFSNTCRFILSCNYSSKIIAPIQSRCASFKFMPIGDDEMISYLNRIVEGENIDISPEALKLIPGIAQGDMRKAVNALQVSASLGKTITPEMIYELTSTIKPVEITTLIETALEGKFIKAREYLSTLVMKYGNSGEEILKQIHSRIYDVRDSTGEKQISEQILIKIIDSLGETAFRISEGSDERIQVEAFLARIAMFAKDY